MQQQRVTVEEFLALPANGNLHELVRGEVRVTPPAKGRHGFVEAAIIAAIDRYLHERARAMGWEPQQGLAARDALVGRVGGGEIGLQFAVPDDPAMIRGADVVYIPPAQLADMKHLRLRAHGKDGADCGRLCGTRRSSAGVAPWATGVVWDEHDYFPAVPALVVEVIGETDRASVVAEKVQDYLAGGGRSVWCIYPDQRAIHIHGADAPTGVVRGTDFIADDLLPGFSLPLNLLFG